MASLPFSIHTRDPRTRARRATLQTPHGGIETPAFVPVGTKAGVKGVFTPGTTLETIIEWVKTNISARAS